ncbi:histidine kinase [Nocardia sp. NPDC050710]|uniref:sensor histidine kinase n=1 Tax=Nocardia sp. NPDC050710 TaxID=3157220 RepID=UPI0033CB8CD3
MLWLEARLALSAVLLAVCVPMVLLCADLLAAAAGVTLDALVRIEQTHWWYAILAPVPPLMVLAILVGLGTVVTALEERTEQLLEHNRLARELHDSIGHALTAAVLQAGAARTTNDPDFTARALGAIEETGRAALADLDRVLRVLRDPDGPGARRPTLADACRLFESARSAGVPVEDRTTGPLDRVPGPISREGYRILQEALTCSTPPPCVRWRSAAATHARVTSSTAPVSPSARRPCCVW